MTLAPEAVNAYLDRPFQNWAVYKQLSDQRLDAIAKRYQVLPQIWGKLRRHQKIMFLIALRAKRFAFHADTGVGKTITVLALAKQALNGHRMLVLVPRNANKAEWQFEIEKHFPELPYCVLPSKLEDKWDALQHSKASLFVETYSGLYWLACEKVYDQKQRRKRLLPSAKQVGALCSLFNALVMDESHAVKTKAKLPYRICKKLGSGAEYVLSLTATPHGRDPSDLWGQMHIVDGGETLGETLGLFRAAFFSERKAFFGPGSKFTFQKHKSALLNRILSNRSIRFPADEAELPKLVEIRKEFSLPQDAGSYYQRARQSFLQAGNKREIMNAWLRMRQISSGFVGYHDDDAGKVAEFEFPENPKLDLLLSLIEGIDAKVIVFYEYTYSGLRIARELKQLGQPVLHLWGGAKDQLAIRKKFNDQEHAILVMQNQFGEGLNLQAAKYGVFYESPVSPIIRYQCRRRFERQHSLHKTVFQYDLVCRDSVDDRILEFLKDGKDLFQLIIEGKANR